LEYTERKYKSLFKNMVKIGDSYNIICTSYGKCFHGVGHELLLHRAMAAQMTNQIENQIEFIINHIASQPEYIDNTALFEAFQENQEKWAEVEAGIYDDYIRGEGRLSWGDSSTKNSAYLLPCPNRERTVSNMIRQAGASS
jgi:hypothetical protein